ncbi:E3 ubiquitin-protein ligase RNF13 [Chionoecetes opilio]|uniref:RING-type E3 ubiquitin transferase n=1 Tax=Chionoecetes opilio TaxID=41210 RepID=A0A8J4YUC3_CHIOP|nr:E3 ubiquitin-protein ligase RNF13 [Chionoecetes opilio]
MMWRVVVVVAVAVAGLTHHTSADVIVLTANQTVVLFQDTAASFGSPIPLEGFKGLAVAVSPPDACKQPISPPIKSMHMWIAVVGRYNCSFTDKVLNAQQAGYGAVIVYNVGSNDLLRMGSNDSSVASEVSIPSVFIGADDGYTILKHFTYKAGTPIRYVLELTDDLPFNLANYLVPFAITIGICFIVMLSFMIVKCVRDYRRSRRHRLSSRSLKKLPIHKFKKGDPYECCAICLEDYVDNDKLRVLPCEHAYHSKCIDPWLTKNRRVCPVCKRKVFTGDERPSDLETDSEDETSPLINSEGGTQGGTFNNARVNPFTEALRQAEERRRSRRRRVSRNVECGPEGYQRLAESSDEEEEEGEEEEGEEQHEGRGRGESEGVAGESKDPTTVTVVVHDAATQRQTPIDTSSLASYGTPPGPVQIAVDIVNSTDAAAAAAGEPAVPEQSGSDVRSEHDYVV